MSVSLSTHVLDTAAGAPAARRARRAVLVSALPILPIHEASLPAGLDGGCKVSRMTRVLGFASFTTCGGYLYPPAGGEAAG